MKLGVHINLILSKSSKGVARFNVLIRRTNRYQLAYAFTTKALRRILEFKTGISERKLGIEILFIISPAMILLIKNLAACATLNVPLRQSG